MKNTYDASYRGKESSFVESLKTAAVKLVNEQKIASQQLPSKLKAKVALASGKFKKIALDVYEELGGVDAGRIWYLTTEGDDQWLVKDANINRTEINRLVNEEMALMRFAAYNADGTETPDSMVGNPSGGTYDPTPEDVQYVSNVVKQYGLDQLPDAWKTFGNYLIDQGYLDETGNVVNMGTNPAAQASTKQAAYDQDIEYNDVNAVSEMVQQYGLDNIPKQWRMYAEKLIQHGILDPDGRIIPDGIVSNYDM
jgi:hypothetical protein